MRVAGFLFVRFDESNQDRDADAQEQGNGQFQPVVRMELEFGEKIATGHAKTSSGAKGQRAAKKHYVGSGNNVRSQIKDRDAEWCGE